MKELTIAEQSYLMRVLLLRQAKIYNEFNIDVFHPPSWAEEELENIQSLLGKLGYYTPVIIYCKTM